MATTYEYAITAIYEALTTVTGKARALGASDLFARGYPPGMPNDMRSIRARDGARRGSVFVGMDRQVPEPGYPDEVAGEHLYRVRFVISRDYHVGDKADFRYVEESFRKACDDFPKTREVLCWPGILATDSSANTTGIDSLAAEGSESRIRIERVGDGRDRLLNCVDTYQALFSRTVA